MCVCVRPCRLHELPLLFRLLVKPAANSKFAISFNHVCMPSGA